VANAVFLSHVGFTWCFGDWDLGTTVGTGSHETEIHLVNIRKSTSGALLPYKAHSSLSHMTGHWKHIEILISHDN
jgi:hypothetical protein